MKLDKVGIHAEATTSQASSRLTQVTGQFWHNRERRVLVVTASVE